MRKRKKDVYKKDFLEFRIKDHVIWQSLFFWTEYFWDTIAINFKNIMGDSAMEAEAYSDNEKEYLKKQLKKFSIRMSGWGELPQESVAMFTENMADSIGLDPVQTQAILASINTIKSPKKKKGGAFKMMFLGRSSGYKKEGELPVKTEKTSKPEKQEKTKSPEKTSKPDKSPKPSEKQPEKLKASSNGPSRPNTAPPFMCEKCRQSFRFKYEMNTHKC